MLECKICNKKVKSIRGLSNHLKVHKISSLQYVEIYGEFRCGEKNPDLIECPICGKYNFSNLQSHLTWKHKMSADEFDAKYPNYKKYTYEYYQQCANAGSKSLKIQKQNQEKWHQTQKKAAKTYDLNHPGLRSHSAHIAHSNLSNELKERWQNPEYRKKMSDKCKEQHRTGNLTDKIVKNPGKYILYNGYKMKSSWEVRFAEFLDKNNIEYQYEPFYFPYVDAIGKHRKYYPDFYIEKLNLIVEIKPFFQLEYDEVKLKKEATINRGFNYQFITENELFKDNTILTKIIDDYKSNITKFN